MTDTLASSRTVASVIGGRPQTDAPGGRITSTNPTRTPDVVAEALLGDASTFVAACRAAREAQGMPFPPPEHEARFAARVLADEAWIAAERAFASLSGNVLEYLYVHPEAQGRGIGSSLIALAKQRRPDGFRLWVFQHLERSRRFYERHGFELVELGDGSGNMEGLPDALYEWRPPTAPTASG